MILLQKRSMEIHGISCNNALSLHFSLTNSHLYHYAGNNPVRYVDPDGYTSYICKSGKDYWCYDYTKGFLWDFGKLSVDCALNFFHPLASVLYEVCKFGYGKVLGREVLNDCTNWVNKLVTKTGKPFGSRSKAEAVLNFFFGKKIGNNNEFL